jgi:TonB-linked SusC/RagA family outer membrane protein
VAGQQYDKQRITLIARHVTVGHVFEQIKKQTGNYFSYHPPDIDLERFIDVDFKNTPLDKVLTIILMGTGLTWTKDDKSISLMKKHGDNIPLPVNQSQPVPEIAQMMIKMLDETVIIGYGTTTPRYSIGNVFAVKGDVIGSQSGTNPLLALQGRVPGLLITQTSGLPGTALKVQIRGQNSLVNGTQPLFIVDGIPYNPILSGGLGSQIWGEIASAFDYMNPEDIQSIDVLKDADATAIYGSRGANGVILISTRKGQPGKTTVKVNVNHGFAQVAKHVDLLNTQQYLTMRREAFRNDGAVPTAQNAPDLLTWDSTRYTDWQKALIGHTADITNVQASVSGGNNTTQYLLSGHYRQETTVFPGDFGNKRGGLHLSTSHSSVNKRFNATFVGSFLTSYTILPAFDFANLITLPPNTPSPYLKDGRLDYSWNNPYIPLVGPLFDAHINNLLGSLSLQYSLMPGLVLKTNIGYHWLSGHSRTITPIAIFAPDMRAGRTGSSQNDKYKAVSRIVEPQITYEGCLGNMHVNAVVGATGQGYKEYKDRISAIGFKEDDLIGNIAFADSVFGKSNTAAYRYIALFGRVGLNWKNRYLLNVSIRRDGSSRFGPRKQYASFGAIGAGWIFTNEPFLKKVEPVLSFGKLRMSYGTTGNDQIGDYQYLDQYTRVKGEYQNVIGLMPASLFNADFAWELTRKAEVGLELGFLKDKLILSACYFNYNSSKQLVSYPLPDITGAGSIIGNLPAKIRNTGWEFVLSTQHIGTKQFEWSSSFNISLGHNKLTAYPDPTRFAQEGRDLVEGKPLSLIYVAKSMGVDPGTGGYLFADAQQHSVTGDNAVSIVPVNLVPTSYGGWRNTFCTKQFQLEILLQFMIQQGINATFDPIFMPGYQRNQYSVVLSRWQKAGDIASRQRFTRNGVLRDGYNKAINSDLGYENASFIRCRYVECSWRLPAKLSQPLRLSESRIYLQGQNLFTLTSYKGLDPETQARTAIPPLRVLTAGLKVSF